MSIFILYLSYYIQVLFIVLWQGDMPMGNFCTQVFMNTYPDCHTIIFIFISFYCDMLVSIYYIKFICE